MHIPAINPSLNSTVPDLPLFTGPKLQLLFGDLPYFSVLPGNGFVLCVPQQVKPQEQEAHFPQLESNPHSPQLEKSPHSNEDLAQPKINFKKL